MESDGFCNLCTWTETWSTYRAAEAAGVWHVYEDHREHWNKIVGNRPPLDPRPIEMGDPVRTRLTH